MHSQDRVAELEKNALLLHLKNKQLKLLFFYFRGLVPLHNACSYGHFEVTEMLLKVSTKKHRIIIQPMSEVTNT